MGITYEQAGAELGQAQLKLEQGFTSITICCIKFQALSLLSRVEGVGGDY